MGDTDAQALIDAIVANPDDLQPWTIYADWLLDRGDVRGELINLEVAREAGNLDPAMTERIGELNWHEENLLSPALAACSHFWKLAFRRGFIHDARCLLGPGAAVAALVADPHAALLAAVDVRELWEPLLAAPPRSLRSLTVTDLGDGARRLDDHLPHLAALVLEGKVPVTTLNHRALRRLVTSEAACRAITTGTFQLPNLEELFVYLADYDDALFDGAILWQPPPRLRTLGLDGSFDVPTLADCPLLAQLTRLSLDRVSLDDLDAILVHAPAFRHLAALQLDLRSWGKRLEPGEVAQLREAFAAALPATIVDADWPRLVRPASDDGLLLHQGPCPTARSASPSSATCMATSRSRFACCGDGRTRPVTSST